MGRISASVSAYTEHRIYFYIRIRKWLLIHICIRIRIGKICGCGYLIEEYKMYQILQYKGEIYIMQ